MRLRLRLGTALAAVALLGLLFGYLAGWRRDPKQDRDHCEMAGALLYRAEIYRLEVATYRAHAAPGHSCATCRKWPLPVAELIARSARRQRELESKAREHIRLAGPAAWHQYTHRTVTFR